MPIFCHPLSFTTSTLQPSVFSAYRCTQTGSTIIAIASAKTRTQPHERTLSNRVQAHLCQIDHMYSTSFSRFCFSFRDASAHRKRRRDCSCPALAERSSHPFSTTNHSVPRLSLALFVPPRPSLCLFLLLCRFLVGNISRNSRSEPGQDFFFFVLRPFQRARSRRNGRGPYFVTR